MKNGVLAGTMTKENRFGSDQLVGLRYNLVSGAKGRHNSVKPTAPRPARMAPGAARR